MTIKYFTNTFGIIHLLRLICLTILLIFIEIKIFSCKSYLNEFLGFNYPSIVFYYILIWISFSFEIYFLFNRLISSKNLQAIKSTFILYILLSISYFLASSFTLYAFITSSDGYFITQPDLYHVKQGIIPITYDCNILRLIGIICGYFISTLYFIAIIFIYHMIN